MAAFEEALAADESNNDTVVVSSYNAQRLQRCREVRADRGGQHLTLKAGAAPGS